MSQSANNSILLVEDNEVNRDMLVRRLTRAGHTVICAGDGAQALDRMRDEQPALVLMDINLPVMDGCTASREARADDAIAHIPIIALTAHAMASDREQALAAGCNDYATKPIDFPQLLAKIAELMP
ncbi:two-component response regulator [Luminiphilus syltensis NOR5-1B]|uniref:Two-component response regulator n=1 Tax=Luminiphilus syltensis NOR5-1B TaxID=565045 RepID=B8KXE4_9GAMM|nr:response regulator [Luminiphilus syltensis]EED36018.1 two-component response regulator [Luminiphilus syltensis NOR5-1B]